MYAKIILLPIAIFLVVGLPGRSPAQSSASETLEFRHDEIVVEIKPGASIDAINERNRTNTIERIHGTNFYRLSTPPNKREEKWRKRVARDRDVLSTSLNVLMTSPTNLFARATVAFPGDHATPGAAKLEYIFQADLFHLLNLKDAQLRSRGAGVTVAIVDTGIDRSHPDLASRLWKDNRPEGEIAQDGIDQDRDGFVDDAYGWDFVDDDNDPTETASDPAVSVAGHGTFIAGLIALLAPDCRILPVRAFTPEGVSNSFTVAAAIKYAVDQGASVINLSFGSTRKSGIVRDAIRYARQRGAVLVAAMGNEREDTDMDPQYPANSIDVIGVAAIDTDSRKAVFSNFGSRVCVAAPGVNLTSTYPDANYAVWSGTSFAAPLTAAQAAMLLAESPGGDVRRISEETADGIDHLNPDFFGKLGKGRINPLTALESIYRAATPPGNYATLTLTPTPSDISPLGQADKLVTGPLQQLRITVRALHARARHTLIIDGKNVSPDGFSATNFGALTIQLSNGPASPDEASRIHLDLPQEFNPVTKIKHVELREGDRIVLQGDFTPISDGMESDQFFVKRTSLSPSGLLSQVAGKAGVYVGHKREEVRVEASDLMPGATYSVFADGIRLGSAVAQSAATQSGFLRLRLMHEGSNGYSIPPALRPITNIKHIELRNSSDRVILQGDFLPGGDGP